MTCSARSFVLASSRSREPGSTGSVPLIGTVVIRSPSTCTSCSGEAHPTAQPAPLSTPR